MFLKKRNRALVLNWRAVFLWVRGRIGTTFETNSEIKKMSIEAEEIWAILREVAQEQKETERKFQETDRKLDKLGELLGNICRNQGDVAEEFFFNSLANDAHLGSVHFDDITKNQHKQRGKFQEEYDIVMTNGDAIGIVEVKYKAHENDLTKLERKMRNFKKLFPIYESYKLYGAIASFHINDDAKEAALNQGFFVLQRSGNVMQTDCGENLLVM
jgi:Holliday junction resolvase-like predicted endonuclease